MPDLDLALRIRADLNSALRGLDQMEGGVDKTGRSMRRAAAASETFTRSVARLVSGDLLARGITSIARAARQLVLDSVRTGFEMRSLEIAMSTAAGGARLAEQAFAFVDAEANRLGLDLLALERGFLRITAAARGTALVGQGARDIFIAIAETSRVLGLSSVEQGQALRAIEQMISKGKVSAEELRGQLGEVVPGIFATAARAYGETTAEFDKLLATGKVLSTDLLPKLAAELRRLYSAGAEEAGQGPGAQIARLDNALLKLQRTVAASGVIDFLGNLADELRFVVEGISDDLGDPQVAANVREFSEDLLSLLRFAVQNASTITTVMSAIAGALVGGRLGGLKGTLIGGAIGLVGGLAREPLARSIIGEPTFEEEQAAHRRRIADSEAEIQSLIQQGRARLGAQFDALLAELNTDTPDAGLSEKGQAFIENLKAQVEALEEVTALERVREEIRNGVLENASQAEQEIAIELARQLDAHKAMLEAEERAARASRAKAESDRALAAHRRQEIDEEASALDRLGELQGRLRREQRFLASPYEAARQAAEDWRDGMQSMLAELAAQGFAVAHLGDVVEEVYAGRIAEAVRAAGEAAEEAADQALRDATDIASGIERAFRQLDEDLNDLSQLSFNAVTGAIRGMEDAFVRFAATGKLEFSSLVDSIAADLARLAIRQHVTLPLFGWLNNLLGSAGAPGGYVPGPHLHSGGIVGVDGTYRGPVPAYAFAGAPRYHDGGIPGLRSNEIPVIVQRGEGIFTLEQMRALGGRGPSSVEVRIDNRGTPQEIESAAPSFDGERLVIDIVASDIARGGRLARVLSDSGGVGR